MISATARQTHALEKDKYDIRRRSFHYVWLRPAVYFGWYHLILKILIKSVLSLCARSHGKFYCLFKVFFCCHFFCFSFLFFCEHIDFYHWKFADVFLRAKRFVSIIFGARVFRSSFDRHLPIVFLPQIRDVLLRMTPLVIDYANMVGQSWFFLAYSGNRKPWISWSLFNNSQYILFEVGHLI